jgi:CheY-like chemotaxis protein
MAKILVVDDSVIDRHLAGALIQEYVGWAALYAEDGRKALTHIKREPPDLVLTDLQMPDLNGLELVETIHRDFPSIPVVLMTAHGSEDVAVSALQKGASSYVPKRNLARDLIPTIEGVLKVTQVSGDHRLVQKCLVESEFLFVLTNDTALIQPLIRHLQDYMVDRGFLNKSDMIRVGTALYEVLLNAIEHGNLELSSELRESGNGASYKLLAEERRRRAPYKDRRVRVLARFLPDEAVFIIGDEGVGYDSSKLPDPTDPSNMEKSSGRGLLLIRTFMDDVRLNEKGNEITLVKRHS